MPRRATAPTSRSSASCGVEVLLMHDRIDEWVVSTLAEFEGKPLHSVAKGDLDLGKLGGEERRTRKRSRSRTRPRCWNGCRRLLKDRASAVRTTERLTDSPACMVSEEYGMSMNLERILKAAGQRRHRHQAGARDQRRPPDRQAAKAETDETRFADWSHVLFDQATAGRRRAARRPRQLRQAAERADADAGWRGALADLDAGVISSKFPV